MKLSGEHVLSAIFFAVGVIFGLTFRASKEPAAVEDWSKGATAVVVLDDGTRVYRYDKTETHAAAPTGTVAEAIGCRR